MNCSSTIPEHKCCCGKLIKDCAFLKHNTCEPMMKRHFKRINLLLWLLLIGIVSFVFWYYLTKLVIEL